MAVIAAMVLANPAHAAIAVPFEGAHYGSDVRRMFSPQVYAFLDDEKISLTVHDVTFEELARTISRQFVFTGPRFRVVGGSLRRVEDFSWNHGNILDGMLFLLDDYPGAFIESRDGGRGEIILHIPP